MTFKRFWSPVALIAATMAATTALAQTKPAPAPATPSAPPAAPAAAAAPPPAPPIQPLQEAVVAAAKALFSNAQLADRAEPKIGLVIDPLIDGQSGAQTYTSARMRFQLMDVVKKDFPRFEVLPFTTDAVGKQPLILIGTFTAINTAGQATGPRDAYRICLALADLKSGKIISKGLARANTQGVNPTPVSAFADSPIWTADEATTGYITSCQGTRAGDMLKPAYVQRLASAAMVADAIRAYDVGNFRQSLDLYTKASSTAGGDQLRVLNGLYLNNVKLGRKKEAEAAFGKLVDAGLKNEKLAVKFLFKPNASQFARARSASSYPMWVNQIAKRAGAGSACLDVVGHTSPTGKPELNEKLSLARAEFIRARLDAQSPGLAKRLYAKGVASKENIIGTGRDDDSDALDRRVEFKSAKCA
jgi:outer membrane protein OmpA-like peptidoglycan-associated protein